MWHYAENKQPVGPLNDDAIKKLVSEGKITTGTLVWKAGMASWQPIEQTMLSSMLPAIPSDNAPPPILQTIPQTVYNQNVTTIPYKSNYDIKFLQSPSNNQTIQPVPVKVGRVPIVITNSSAYKDGVQVNVSSDFNNRIINSLKASNLFLDAGMNFINFGDNDKKYHQLTFSAQEYWDLHQAKIWVSVIVLLIAGAFFIPLYLLLLFLKFDKEFSQELTVALTTHDGISKTYSSKTIGQLHYGLFINQQAAADALGGNVTTSNLNSIMNQIIQDCKGLNL